MKKKIAFSLIGLGLIGYVISFYGSEAALIDENSDLDPQLVIRAHRIMIRRALKGDMPENQSDEELTAELRKIVAGLS